MAQNIAPHVYRPSRRAVLITWSFGLWAALICAGGLAVSIVRRDLMGIVVVAGGLAVFVAIARAVRSMPRTAEIRDDGLVLVGGRRTTTIPWAELREVGRVWQFGINPPLRWRWRGGTLLCMQFEDQDQLLLEVGVRAPHVEINNLYH